MKKELIKIIKIPFYGQKLELVVSGDIIFSQVRRKARFGLTDIGPCLGTFCYHEWHFSILLNRADISHDLIAHEVFHATHRIMDYVTSGEEFDAGHHENYAYLNGFLVQNVYNQLKKWKIRIK